MMVGVALAKELACPLAAVLMLCAYALLASMCLLNA
jgi:uncharacterized protein YfaQ (DUF2300 family)